MLAHSTLISNRELIDSFSIHIRSTTHYKIAKKLWDANPILSDWFTGNIINLGTDSKPELACLSTEELIETFKIFLPTHLLYVVKFIWDNSKTVQNWFTGKSVNFGSAEQPDWRIVSPDEILANFQAALGSQIPSVISAQWNENTMLADWYGGKNVNFGTELQPSWRVISLEVLIADFKSTLSGRSHAASTIIWNENPKLRDWLSGVSVNYGTDKKPEWCAITLSEVLKFLRSVIYSRSYLLITTFCDTNANLKSWLSGRIANTGSLGIPCYETIAFFELVDIFLSSLSSQAEVFSKFLWNENPILAEAFSGGEINFGSSDKPKLRTLTYQEIIRFFMTVLVSRQTFFIQAIWQDNVLLRTAIAEVDLDTAKILLKKVLASNLSKTQFMMDYVTQINDKAMLESVLGEINKDCHHKKKVSDYRANQIFILQSRLDSMDSIVPAWVIDKRKIVKAVIASVNSENNQIESSTNKRICLRPTLFGRTFENNKVNNNFNDDTAFAIKDSYSDMHTSADENDIMRFIL